MPMTQLCRWKYIHVMTINIYPFFLWMSLFIHTFHASEIKRGYNNSYFSCIDLALGPVYNQHSATMLLLPNTHTSTILHFDPWTFNFYKIIPWVPPIQHLEETKGELWRLWILKQKNKYKECLQKNNFGAAIRKAEFSGTKVQSQEITCNYVTNHHFPIHSPILI